MDLETLKIIELGLEFYALEKVPPQMGKSQNQLVTHHYGHLRNITKSVIGAQGRNRTGMVLPPRDFKSLASTCFATWALFWRLRPESDRRRRLCRPLHDHSATQPCEKEYKKSDGMSLQFGAGNEARTRDPNLGKVVLYH